MTSRPATLSDEFKTRRNLAERQTESWRPPLHAAPGGTARTVLTAARRAFDLQAQSVWRDVAPELRAEHGTVLDVGCGSQPFRGLLPDDASYLGIDTSDAAEHFGYEFPDTRYFDGDVWPVDDDFADTVLATETLEHVIEPQRFLREAHRCVKPGGRIILTVPFSARWHFIPHDYWRFTPSSLVRLLTDAGFTEIAVYGRGNATTVAAYKTMALVLPLLFPQRRSFAARAASRLLGVVGIPVMLATGLVGHLSLRSSGGDDCLGYTAFARRPE